MRNIIFSVNHDLNTFTKILDLYTGAETHTGFSVQAVNNLLKSIRTIENGSLKVDCVDKVDVLEGDLISDWKRIAEEKQLEWKVEVKQK